MEKDKNLVVQRLRAKMDNDPWHKKLHRWLWVNWWFMRADLRYFFKCVFSKK
jgi:hypothetical protein